MYKNSLIFIIITIYSIVIQGCSVSIPEYKSKIEFDKTDYGQIISSLLKKASNQMFPNMNKEEILLVSNFSEVVSMNSDTRLSFLLTDILKTKLVANYSYTIREVQLAKTFKLGKDGFKVLTRDGDEINNRIKKARYAIVGTYTLTKNQLILFLKMINIRDGSVLAASSHSVELTQEIIDDEQTNLRLNNKLKNIYQPVVL